MKISKEHVGKDIWLEPAGNCRRNISDAKLNGSYFRVIKVARVNVTVAEVCPDGSLWREFNIRRSDYNDGYYKSILNGGYYAHLNEDAYLANKKRLEAVNCVAKAFKYGTGNLNNLSMSQLKDIASMLDIKLPE